MLAAQCKTGSGTLTAADVTAGHAVQHAALKVAGGAPVHPYATQPADKQNHAPLRAVEKQANKHPGLSPVLGSIIAIAIIFTIFTIQLGVSMLMQQGSYHIHELETAKRDLTRNQKVMEQSAQSLSSPQALQKQAIDLGMVQNVRPANLRLSDGAILGSLTSTIEGAQQNLVPNATLQNPATAAAIQQEHVSQQTPKPPVSDIPVHWQGGRLPAPQTH